MRLVLVVVVLHTYTGPCCIHCVSFRAILAVEVRESKDRLSDPTTSVGVSKVEKSLPEGCEDFSRVLTFETKTFITAKITLP